jgi:isocitrate dehydrogenase kinase/phosphatase
MTTRRLARRCAICIHERFQDYEDRFRRITRRAPERFLNRRWTQVQADTTERLSLYAAVVDQTETVIRSLLENRVADGMVWAAAKADYAARIASMDDRELAETFFNSVTRRIFGTVGVNRQIEFIHEDHPPALSCPTESLCRTYPLTGSIEPIIRQIFSDYSDVQIDHGPWERCCRGSPDAWQTS